MTDLSTLVLIAIVAVALVAAMAGYVAGTVYTDKRVSRSDDGRLDDFGYLLERLEALEEIVGRSEMHADNEAEVLQVVIGRVRQLEDAASKPVAPERLLALPAVPTLRLVDGDVYGTAPLARSLGDMPALTISTSYVPIVRPDLTASTFNRASVEQVRAMLNADREPGEAITGELVEVAP